MTNGCRIPRRVQQQVALAALLVATAAAAPAADLYWSGTGTWNTATANWATTSGGPYDAATWSNSPADAAFFEGTAGTVTLGEPITAAGLTFTTTGYTITGGALTLTGGTTTIALGSGISGTIASTIAGSSVFEKTGAGTLTLTGANTFSSNVIVGAGTIRLGSVGALGQSNTAVTKVTVNSGGTVDLNGTTDPVYGYTISGAGADGSGAIVNTGAGIGNFTAQTTNIRLAADAAIGGSGNWALLTFSFNPTSLDLGGFTLTKVGSNTISLCNTTATAGTIRIAAGTLSQANRDNSVGNVAFALDNVSGATLQLNDRSMTIGSLAGGGSTGGNVSLGGNTLTTGGLNTSTTYSGAIGGSGGLVKTGTGTLTLDGANTYTGTTTVNSGTLQFGSGGTTGGLASSAISIASGANFTVNRSDAVTFGALFSGSGSVTQLAAGTTTLTNANTYSGGTLLSAGVLAIGSNSALGTGTLTFAGGAIRPTATRVLSNAIVAAASTSSNLIDAGTGDLMYTGTATGSGTLIANSTTSRSMWLQGDWSGFTGQLTFTVNGGGTN